MVDHRKGSHKPDPCTGNIFRLRHQPLEDFASVRGKLLRVERHKDLEDVVSAVKLSFLWATHTEEDLSQLSRLLPQPQLPGVPAILCSYMGMSVIDSTWQEKFEGLLPYFQALCCLH